MARKKRNFIPRTELGRIKLFKKTYFIIKNKLIERDTLIKEILISEYVIKNVVKMHIIPELQGLINRLKPEFEIPANEYPGSSLVLFYKTIDNAKLQIKNIQKSSNKENIHLEELFDKLNNFLNVNYNIFELYKRIEKHKSLNQRMIEFKVLESNHNIQTNNFNKIINKLDTKPYSDFFINFEKVIKEEEIRAENLNLIRQQRIHNKRSFQHNNSIRKFTRIIAYAALGQLLYFFNQFYFSMYPEFRAFGNTVSYILIALLVLLIAVELLFK